MYYWSGFLVSCACIFCYLRREKGVKKPSPNEIIDLRLTLIFHKLYGKIKDSNFTTDILFSKDLLSAVKILVEKFSESKTENAELIIENKSLAAENKNFKTKSNADAAKMLKLEATIEQQKLQTQAKLINAEVMSFAQNKVLQDKLQKQAKELSTAKVECDELRNGKVLTEAQKKVLQDKLQEQAKEISLTKVECDELRNGKAEAQNKIMRTQFEEQHEKIQDLIKEMEKQNHSVLDAPPLRFVYFIFEVRI